MRLGRLIFDMDSVDRKIYKEISKHKEISFLELKKSMEGIKEFELRTRLDRLHRNGIIYEVKSGHYAITPLDLRHGGSYG